LRRARRLRRERCREGQARGCDESDWREAMHVAVGRAVTAEVTRRIDVVLRTVYRESRARVGSSKFGCYCGRYGLMSQNLPGRSGDEGLL
jgi:hypothetical protein